MILFLERKRAHISFKLLSVFLILSFLLSSVVYFNRPSSKVYASFLPAPGQMLYLSPPFVPALLKGVTVHPEDPFRFDFIIEDSDEKLKDLEFKQESQQLIKYFLASLTLSEGDIWVNLSPYEQNRVTPHSLGITELGKTLLSQDYILKQLLASLMYPESPTGKKFWKQVYEKAYALYGTTNIPINTFNKVWIMPAKAVVETKDNTAYVAESRLKVLLEEDYLALKENLAQKNMALEKISQGQAEALNRLSASVVKEVILPELEKEINYGKNFAQLRQAYNALILATWFKEKLKEHIISQIYVDKQKVKGVDLQDKEAKEKIYRQYLEAYKKGVYNYIKTDYDLGLQKEISRRYYAGGFALPKGEWVESKEVDELPHPERPAQKVEVALDSSSVSGQQPSAEKGGQERGQAASPAASSPATGETIRVYHGISDISRVPGNWFDKLKSAIHEKKLLSPERVHSLGKEKNKVRELVLLLYEAVIHDMSENDISDANVRRFNVKEYIEQHRESIRVNLGARADEALNDNLLNQLDASGLLNVDDFIRKYCVWFSTHENDSAIINNGRNAYFELEIPAKEFKTQGTAWGVIAGGTSLKYAKRLVIPDISRKTEVESLLAEQGLDYILVVVPSSSSSTSQQPSAEKGTETRKQAASSSVPSPQSQPPSASSPKATWTPLDEDYPLDSRTAVLAKGEVRKTVDLKELPAGTIVYLNDPSSWVNYLIVIEEQGMLKLWLNNRKGCFLGSPNLLVTTTKENFKDDVILRAGQAIAFPFFRGSEHLLPPEEYWGQSFPFFRVLLPQEGDVSSVSLQQERQHQLQQFRAKIEESRYSDSPADRIMSDQEIQAAENFLLGRRSAYSWNEELRYRGFQRVPQILRELCTWESGQATTIDGYRVFMGKLGSRLIARIHSPAQLRRGDAVYSVNSYYMDIMALQAELSKPGAETHLREAGITILPDLSDAQRVVHLAVAIINHNEKIQRQGDESLALQSPRPILPGWLERFGAWIESTLERFFDFIGDLIARFSKKERTPQWMLEASFPFGIRNNFDLFKQIAQDIAVSRPEQNPRKTYRSIRRVVGNFSKKPSPTVYYLGIGQDYLFSSLRDTDYRTLVGVEKETLTFADFQLYFQAQADWFNQNNIGNGEAISNIRFSMIDHWHYRVDFSLGGEEKTIIVYYSTNSLTFIPPEVLEGYDILYLFGSSFVTNHFSAPVLLEKLNPGGYVQGSSLKPELFGEFFYRYIKPGEFVRAKDRDDLYIKQGSSSSFSSPQKERLAADKGGQESGQAASSSASSSAKSADEIFRELNVTEKDELISIGPGLPTSQSGAVWEQAFIRRGGKVRVYQPDAKLNQAWQQYGSLYPGRIEVLPPDKATFESNSLTKGQGRFVVAMSVFSDPAFYKYSHYDPVKKENIYVLTSEGDNLVSAVAHSIDSGSYFIYGTYSPAETMGGYTDVQEPRRAEQGFRVLQNNLAGTGLELTGKYKGKDGDTPNESHTWEVYQATTSSSSVPVQTAAEAEPAGTPTKGNQNLGGIDLNSANLNLEVRGSDINLPQFKIPFDLETFEGFTFRILKIEPVQNSRRPI